MFLKYTAAVQQEEERAAAYRIYVTDALFGFGVGHKSRYYDMVFNKEKRHFDNIPGDKIIDEIAKKYHLKIIDGKEEENG